MNSNVCSFCQREYGTISRNNKPIFMTLDHMNPICREKLAYIGKHTSKRKIKDNDRNHLRKGNRCATLDDIITCCNECNELKASHTIIGFSRLLNTNHCKNNVHGSYMTPEIARTIQHSISVILKQELHPIELRIYTYDLII